MANQDNRYWHQIAEKMEIEGEVITYCPGEVITYRPSLQRHLPRPEHRINSVLPLADYPAKYRKPCPGYDDDYPGERPKWWTSKKEDKDKKDWLEFSLWEYFYLPREMWRTEI